MWWISILGKIYYPDGTELEGLGILDFYTKSKTDRLTGDIVIKSDTFGTIVGFENHGGRTLSYTSIHSVTAGVMMMKKEGIHYKNLLGNPWAYITEIMNLLIIY